jgi:dihydrofolate reductase
VKFRSAFLAHADCARASIAQNHGRKDDQHASDADPARLRYTSRDRGKTMRKLIVSNVMTLDGFFEGPNGLDWVVLDADFFEYGREMLHEAGSLLFGRKTYEHMAAHWPAAPADEIAYKMNHLPKLVFSGTLDKVEWNNSTLVKGDYAEEVLKLKQQEAQGALVILGSAMLASHFLQYGLVDEYRVILNPVLIGEGKPLFPDIQKKINLKLTRTKPLASGVIILYYERAEA